MKRANNLKLNSKNFDDVLNNIIEEVTNSKNPMDEIDNNNNNDNVDIIESEHEISNTNESSVLHKLDLMSLNNGWNDKNEKIIISIGENASSYKWMHERSASVYKLIHKILSIILILFSTGLSAESIIPDDQNNVAISILRRIFTYIITVISVLINFLKMEQLSEQHLTIANKFSELYHEIQQQMCMFRKDRYNATNYLTDILKRYDTHVVSGPTINTIILNQFKNTFKNADISIPDIADRIQKIEIITEPNSTNDNSSNTSKNKYVPNLLNYVSNDDLEKNKTQKRYAKYGNSNLKQIHDVFKICGDITDYDIQNANEIELKELRKKFLDGKSNFEYERFRNHNLETD